MATTDWLYLDLFKFTVDFLILVDDKNIRVY